MYPVVRITLVVGTLTYFSPERGPLPPALTVATATPAKLETIGRTLDTAARLSSVAPRIVGDGLVAPFQGERPGAATAPPLPDTLTTLDRISPWQGQSASGSPVPR